MQVLLSRSLLQVLLCLCLCLYVSALSSSSSSSSAVPDYSGVIASDNVGSSLGISVWHVNKVGSFAVPNIVQISWVVDPTNNMTGQITAVDPVASTITVLVTTIHGQTGILWTPWAITLVSLNNLVSSSSTGTGNTTAPLTSSSIPASNPSSSSRAASNPSSSSAAATSNPSPSSAAASNPSSSSVQAISFTSSSPADFTGVVATNSRTSSLGVLIWNVNKVGSFAPLNIVRITWTGDAGDFMVGQIISVDAVNSTITVDVTSISGPTNIVWSPWTITLISLTPESSTGVNVGSNAATSSYSSFSPINTIMIMSITGFLLSSAVVLL